MCGHCRKIRKPSEGLPMEDGTLTHTHFPEPPLKRQQTGFIKILSHRDQETEWTPPSPNLRRRLEVYSLGKVSGLGGAGLRVGKQKHTWMLASWMLSPQHPFSCPTQLLHLATRRTPLGGRLEDDAEEEGSTWWNGRSDPTPPSGSLSRGRTPVHTASHQL